MPSRIYIPFNFGFEKMELIEEIDSYKVKVSPIHNLILGKCLLKLTLVLSHWICEVGLPVSLFAASISPVNPPGPHSLLGRKQVSVQPVA